MSDDFRWNRIKKKATEVTVCKAFDLFRSHGIEPILIKGYAAGRFYPDSILRDSVDIDIAVSVADYESASGIDYATDAHGLAIDLHRELRHFDTVLWKDLFNNSEIINLEMGSIRVLCHEDHLRVLCVHWLTDGGSNKDRLWDIYYLVKNRPADFDWNRFLNIVEHNRRRWLICTVGLAQRFLGLDLTNTPLENAGEELPRWFVKAIEKEWTADTPFMPLFASMQTPSIFWNQLKKRLPPNPITSTILMNGSLDAKTRIFYQAGTSLYRISPSIRNIAKTLFGKSK